MKSHTALVAEDEPLLREQLVQALQESWPELQIVATAGDGDAALAAIAEYDPDIAFLDIRMPGMSGLEVARHAQGRCHIVFVTAYDEHALAAFEYGAVDYLVKPLERERLQITVERLKQRVNTVPSDLTPILDLIRAERTDRSCLRWIQASIGDKLKFVAVHNVLYFQADAKYTRVATMSGDLHIRKTIKELAQELPSDQFWQVNRGIIVNIEQIEMVLRDAGRVEIRLKGRSELLPVSQPYFNLFRQM